MTSKFTPLKGGLDLVTPPIDVDAGAISYGLNYYEATKGGYRTVDGYERYDGRPSPSGVIYHVVEITQWDLRVTAVPLTVGGTISVGSAAYEIYYLDLDVTGTVMSVVCAEPTGIPPTDLEDNPLPFDTNCLIVKAIVRAADTVEKDAEYIDIATEILRARILEVPGSGNILGVSQLLDNRFAWRSDGAGALKTFLASPIGWQEVEYSKIVSMSTTNVPAIGDSINSGAYTVTGVFQYLDDAGVKDVSKNCLLLKGAGTPTVSLVLTNSTKGETAGTILEVIAYTPQDGGKVRAINHNFYGGVATYNMYFCDGVNPAAEYSSEFAVINPICSNYRLPTTDTISHIVAHTSVLFMSTGGGTFLTTVVGEPLVIDGFLGSQEIGVGDTITGFHKANADLLLIFTRRTTLKLTGRIPADWQLIPVSVSSGAFEDCIVALDDAFSLDDRGINSLSRTQKLGGMNAGTVSENVRDLVDDLKTDVTCAIPFRKLNQARFYAGKRFLFMSRIPFFTQSGEGTRYSFAEGEMGHTVLVASSEEDSVGTECFMFGSDDGFVYQMDRGTSFDGLKKSTILHLHFNHFGSPHVKKRLRAIDIESTVVGQVPLQMSYALNEGQQQFSTKDFFLVGGKNGWDSSTFDLSQFDTTPIYKKRVRLKGTGSNIQVQLYHSSKTHLPFTFTGITFNYDLRGLRVN